MGNKVSVAIATYNGSRFLREQLDSLYAQTRVPDEIVVCDDNSTDNTVEILEEYHRRYGLVYYINKPALGVNDNFMRVLNLCHGDFICICDQDDIWFKEKVETLLEEMLKHDQSNPVIVASSITDVDAAGVPIASPLVKLYESNWESTFISTSNSQGCTMMLNRSLLERATKIYNEKPESHKVMYDVLLSLVAASCGIKINTGVPLMYYRHHDRNVVGTIDMKRNKSFKDKVKDMPTYYPFLMDYRIEEFVWAKAFLADEELNKGIGLFLQKMEKLYSCRNSLYGLLLVLSLKELSFSRKLKIMMLTPMSIILKKTVV